MQPMRTLVLVAVLAFIPVAESACDVQSVLRTALVRTAARPVNVNYTRGVAFALVNQGAAAIQLTRFALNATACEEGITLYLAPPGATVAAPSNSTRAAWSAYSAQSKVVAGVASVPVPSGFPSVPPGKGVHVYAFAPASCGAAIARFSASAPSDERLWPGNVALSDGNLSALTGIPVTNATGSDAFSGAAASATAHENGRLPVMDVSYTMPCSPSAQPLVPLPLPPLPPNATAAPPPGLFPPPLANASSPSPSPPPSEACCSAAYFTNLVSDNPVASAAVIVAIVGVICAVVYTIRRRRNEGGGVEGDEESDYMFTRRVKLKL